MGDQLKCSVKKLVKERNQREHWKWNACKFCEWYSIWPKLALLCDFTFLVPFILWVLCLENGLIQDTQVCLASDLPSFPESLPWGLRARLPFHPLLFLSTWFPFRVCKAGELSGALIYERHKSIPANVMKWGNLYWPEFLSGWEWLWLNCWNNLARCSACRV